MFCAWCDKWLLVKFCHCSVAIWKTMAREPNLAHHLFVVFKKFYLFIWLLHGLVAVCGIFCCGQWASLVLVPSCPWGIWDFNSPTKDQTRVPCIERWILNHETTGEVFSLSVFVNKIVLEHRHIHFLNLLSVFSYATTSEFSSCDRDYMGFKA